VLIIERCIGIEINNKTGQDQGGQKCSSRAFAYGMEIAAYTILVLVLNPDP
jgi:hypothetical protein